MSRLHTLTALKVKHSNVTGRYADGGGLYMQVSPNGTKSWIFRYRANGKRRHLGLGPLTRVTLSEARELAGAARLTLRRDGVDPIAARQGKRITALVDAAKVVTFSQAAERYIEAHTSGWSTKHTEQWRASLTTHAFPVIGSLPVQAVDTPLVMKIIEPIWTVKTETASRLRNRIEAVLDWAKAHGHRSGENPARWTGHLENLLAKKSQVTKVAHHAALPYSQMQEFMAQLRDMTGTAARALEFTILTASRSGEVFFADWAEIDLVARLWTIPAVRMKSSRDHRVPLSNAAVAILEAIPGDRTGIVFKGPRAGRELAKMSLAGVLARMGRNEITTHGFRSAFVDWARDRTEFARDVVEAALAHAIGDKTEAAYRRSDALEKRRRLMAAWGDVCSGKAQATAEVIPLRRA